MLPDICCLTLCVLFTRQAYVRTHLNTAIYVLDFLSICKAKGDEQQQAQRLIEALTLLLTQACMPSKLLLKCLLCFVSQTVLFPHTCRSSMLLPLPSPRTSPLWLPRTYLWTMPFLPKVHIEWLSELQHVHHDGSYAPHSDCALLSELQHVQAHSGQGCGHS